MEGRYAGLVADGARPPQALEAPWKHGWPTVLAYCCFGCEASCARRWTLKTDHWFYGLFQSAPDLIALLLPAAGAAGASAVPSLRPDSPGDALYRFEAP